MKRFVAILMAVLMIAVAGCSGDGNNSTAGNSTASESSTASGDSAASEDDSLFNAPGDCQS